MRPQPTGPTAELRDRVRQVWEARGEKQGEFADAMTREAKKLRIAKRYDATMISKMISGVREVAVEDIAVIAALDPLGRGKLWLGWNEDRDATRTGPRDGGGIPMHYGTDLADRRSSGASARKGTGR